MTEKQKKARQLLDAFIYLLLNGLLFGLLGVTVGSVCIMFAVGVVFVVLVNRINVE